MALFKSLLFSAISLSYHLQASTLLNEAPNSAIEFVADLINLKLTTCKLMIIQDREDNSEALNFLVVKTRLSYYNVKYSYPLPPELENLAETHKKFGISVKNLSSVMTSIETLPVKFPHAITNHYKRSGQCFTLVLLINDLRSEFLSQLFKMLTPIYLPKSRKDEDYFIFVTKGVNMEKLLFMEELPARIKFKIAVGLSDEGTLEIKSVCFFCNNGLPTVVKFPSSVNADIEYFPDFVKNLNGKVLKVSVPNMASRIEVDKTNDGVQNAIRGLWKNLFEDFLGVKFNFSYTMFYSTGVDGVKGGVMGGGTGLQLNNGTWIGIVGDIYYGKADLGILASKTLKRIHYMDTSDTFFDVTYLIFITSQGKRIFTPAALLWPFDTLMWSLIILSTIISFLFFKFLTSSVTRLEMGGNLSFSHRGKICKDTWKLTHQIQFIMTSFLDQDCVMPSFGPLRCFVALWLFFTLIITSVYRSKLVSLMAFPVVQEPPKTFAQLAFADYTVGFLKKGDSAYNTLKSSTDSVYVKLVAEMEIITQNGLQCLEKVVQTSKYACIGYEFSLKYLKERNLSDSDTRKLVYAPDHTYNIWTGLNFEGRSIFKTNFDKYLGLTRPMHFADMWERDDFSFNVREGKLKWWNETGQMEKAKSLDGDENTKLSINHLVGSFWVLVVGIVVSLIAFLAENIHFRWKYVLQALSGLWDKISICFSRIVRCKINRINGNGHGKYHKY